jgi:hypothetical protein
MATAMIMAKVLLVVGRAGIAGWEKRGRRRGGRTYYRMMAWTVTVGWGKWGKRGKEEGREDGDREDSQDSQDSGRKEGRESTATAAAWEARKEALQGGVKGALVRTTLAAAVVAAAVVAYGRG